MASGLKLAAAPVRRRSPCPSHVGGAETDRRLEVAAHPDADQRQPLRRRQLGQQRRVQGHVLVFGRNRHQPLDRKAELAATQCRGSARPASPRTSAAPRRCSPGRGDAACALAPSPWRSPAPAWAGPGSGSRRTTPRHRPPCSIGPDQMQLDARPAFPQRRPAARPPGHSSRRTRAGRRRACLDPRLGLRLGHGDQGHLGGRPPRGRAAASIRARTWARFAASPC